MGQRYEDGLRALAVPDGAVQGYGFPLRDAPGALDGLYGLDRPRRRERGLEVELAWLFRRYEVVEGNGERFLVARMAVEPPSRRRLAPYAPPANVPSRTMLRALLDEPPEPRLRLAWLPEGGVWGVTAVGSASGVIVDRRALAAAVARLPEADEFLRAHFLAVGADPLEEARAEYLAELERAARTDAGVARNREALLSAFDEIVMPGRPSG